MSHTYIEIKYTFDRIEFSQRVIDLSEIDAKPFRAISMKNNIVSKFYTDDRTSTDIMSQLHMMDAIQNVLRKVCGGGVRSVVFNELVRRAVQTHDSHILYEAGIHRLVIHFMCLDGQLEAINGEPMEDYLENLYKGK